MGGGDEWGKARRAILRPQQAEQHFRLDRHEASALIAPFVEYLWSVEWDLTDRDPFTQRVLPSPSIHLTVRPEGSILTGLITRSDFAYTLVGAGRVVGLRFRPGGLRPFLAGPVSALRDRSPQAADVLPWDADTIAARVATAGSVEVAASCVDDALAAIAPPPDPVVERVSDLVDVVRDDPRMLRVEALAEHAGLSVRSLQRTFTEYVGAGPKWVIRCLRLHEAAARAAASERVDWAGLATELGYSDQAHLVRDFTRTVGEPPARYARTT